MLSWLFTLTYLLQFEQFVLDRKGRQVYYRHQEIELTAKEFNLLEYLMRHLNQVLTRDREHPKCVNLFFCSAGF
ncbi:winged helix-turn-helix domain-containing protein [Nostoc sp.]|uniref:winged helix-turn-helix domain-containing protein n=1 Tax=Nostoc sp. TaxID=1180 RepID=UPI003FA58DDD